MKKLHTLIGAGAILALAALLPAQDAVSVDPKHYKVEFENEHVRVLRIRYGPGEKSVMHSHPDSVAIMVSGGPVKMNLPGGKAELRESKPGDVMWAPAETHLPENTSSQPMEVILVELKSKPAK